ncbi:MAG: ribosome assembly factor SBDS [Candidatus Aenigmatarchaeota archaeon]
MAVDVDKAVVCRLKHSGRKFEILVNPSRAFEFKKGAKVDMRDILAYPSIYKDVSSTDVVAEDDLQKAFGTVDPFKIAEKILRDGELQLTTEQKRGMVEQKRMQIAEIISRRGTNPQTNAPHPPQRVLAAMEKAGVNIDAFTDADLQFDRVVKALRTLLPISFQRVTIAIRVQPQHAGRVYSILKGMGTTKKEQWLNDGSLQVEIEVLGGMQQELFDKLANLTHGNFESKVVSKVDV